MTEEYPIYSPRKLIEVALPLDAVNAACKREKSIRHGQPSTLHLWWARRPLAAARAVIFAQMVNDPGYQQGGGFKYGVNKKEAAEERKRLFDIIEELVLWESTTNEAVLEKARAEIRRSWREVCKLNKDHPKAAELFNPDKLPGLHDPFAGGGSIPLEAQRLGLKAYASDLNPVAVLINKAMIEIPPKFAGQAPVNPEAGSDRSLIEQDWRGAAGLAEDVRFYGQRMGDAAKERIGNLYLPVEITAKMVTERPDLKPYQGKKLTVIAWIWSRTVKSPNPAFSHVDVPLASTYVLSSKKGKEAYVQPVIDGDKYHFEVKIGPPTSDASKGSKSGGSHSPFVCLLSGTPMQFQYLRAQGKSGKLGKRLLAIVAQCDRGRIYLSPSEQIERQASTERPNRLPSLAISHWPGRTNVVEYGLTDFADLFTERQLAALTTFADLVNEVRKQIEADAIAAGLPDESGGLDGGGCGAKAYAEAVSVYLALSVDKAADYNCTLVTWINQRDQAGHAFTKQSLPMVWDFVEVNPLIGAAGDPTVSLRGICKVITSTPAFATGISVQKDATSQFSDETHLVFSTDPPYFDNVSYANWTAPLSSHLA